MALATNGRIRRGGKWYSGRSTVGRRPDLDNRFFRSRWEANYARFLNFLLSSGTIKRWVYEPITFWFENIRRGCRSYTPDFLVERPDGTDFYVEVKGWMDPKSKTKLARMARYYPHVPITLIGATEYKQLAKQWGKSLPNWE